MYWMEKILCYSYVYANIVASACVTDMVPKILCDGLFVSEVRFEFYSPYQPQQPMQQHALLLTYTCVWFNRQSLNNNLW